MLKDGGDPSKGTLRLSHDPTPSERLSSERVHLLYDMHGKELLAFLIGVLRDPGAAQDVLQVVFRRLLEVGQTAQQETIKGWLFTVAMREALEFRRRLARNERHLKEYSKQVENREWIAAPDVLINEEEILRLREILLRLPIEQQQVVRIRIQEDKTFAAIADELNIPLNTVLTRMRLALEKLRKWMNAESGNDHVGR